MSNIEKPLVSILTPVYNGEAYLAECIESVLSQTYPDFEYIIVNNCSTDSTLTIAETYARRDGRVKVVTNERFLQVIENHNNAFNRMSPVAKYCKVVSSDDTLVPSCLTKMVDLAETNPSVGIVGCYQVSGSVVRWVGYQYPRQVIPGREACKRDLLQRQEFIQGQSLLGFGSPTSLLYRADLVRRTENFYPNPSPHSDVSACFECLLDSDYGFVYEILCHERLHEDTQTAASRKINRFLSATLNDLLRYGPKLLTEEEMLLHRKKLMGDYHRYLAMALLTQGHRAEFWDYHRSRLQELGFPLRKWNLVNGTLLLVAGAIINPGLAVQKFRNRLASKRAQRSAAAQMLDSKRQSGTLSD
ncbi:MAG TPA: glycosyltransferase family 2 protein [Edaphobacter sp.]|nr:glycosyltransferase family 2 protein [Edaphobacter sp.]